MHNVTDAHLSHKQPIKWSRRYAVKILFAYIPYLSATCVGEPELAARCMKCVFQTRGSEKAQEPVS